ncbi:MAG: hypothetical protein U9O82_07335 [Thermodesulfobacteriota bacterium]|nr:hypothetical protein [Thermodesulfobacteriota bacterium]
MKHINVNFFFSSPGGDIPAGTDEMSRSFLLSPTESHPFLTLGDYFGAIREFVLKNGGDSLLSALNSIHLGVRFEDISEIRILSVAHGAFYHLASAEIVLKDKIVKFCVSTALTDEGRACLENEFNIIGRLNRAHALPYLPQTYFKGKIESGRGDMRQSLSMFLGDWFENYYEWHLSKDKEKGVSGIRIWDTARGNRFATDKERFEIFKQSSKILTLYYDTRDSSRIYPWHHAAGDFIVKTDSGGVDIRLTTVRHYGPIMELPPDDPAAGVSAIIHFFLDLSVSMRLDRMDGVGEAAWVGDYSVDAVTRGFFEGLTIMEAKGRYHLGSVNDLLDFLKSLTMDEIKMFYQPILEFYRQEKREDYFLIWSHLDNHIKTLHRVIYEI